MRSILRLGFLACCFAALSACGAPPPPELPPDEIVQRAAKGMAGQSTLRFTIDIAGTPAMLNPALGLALRSGEGGLDDAELVGVESIGDAQMYHVKGRIDGSRLWRMSGGLIGSSTVDVDVWVDPQTFAVRKIVLVDPTTDPGDPSIWTMTFSKFGEPVTIEAPDL